MRPRTCGAATIRSAARWPIGSTATPEISTWRSAAPRRSTRRAISNTRPRLPVRSWAWRGKAHGSGDLPTHRADAHRNDRRPRDAGRARALRRLRDAIDDHPRCPAPRHHRPAGDPPPPLDLGRLGETMTLRLDLDWTFGGITLDETIVDWLDRVHPTRYGVAPDGRSKTRTRYLWGVNLAMQSGPVERFVRCPTCEEWS